jgi:hypothetical protein
VAVADDDEEEAAALDAARSARREIGEEGDGASMMIDADCIVDSLNSRLLIVPVERNAAAARRIMLFFFRGERERERESSEEWNSEELRVEALFKNKESVVSFLNLDLLNFFLHQKPPRRARGELEADNRNRKKAFAYEAILKALKETKVLNPLSKRKH